MKAELKTLFNSDYDLETFVPESEDFCLYVEAHVGELDKDGSDIFTFHVCTAGWLAKGSSQGALFLKGCLVVPFYNFEMIKSKIGNLIKSINGNDWNDYAMNLSRYAHWEFENYID